MSTRARKRRRARRKLNRLTLDEAIRDVGYGFLMGCEESDVRAELVRRGFVRADAFLLTIAGQLLARWIEEIPGEGP
jgi:uncharacterized protein YjiS (DUF1127 family)